MKLNEGLSLSPSHCIRLKSYSYLKNRSSSSSDGIINTITDEYEQQKLKRQINSYFSEVSPPINSCHHTKSDSKLLTYADIKEDTNNFMGNQSNGVNLSTIKTIQCRSIHIKSNSDANVNGDMNFNSNLIIKPFKPKLKTKKVNLFITPIKSISLQSNNNSHIMTDSNSNHHINYNKYLNQIDDQELKKGSTIEIENLKINEINTISVNSKSVINNNIISSSPKNKIRRYASMDALNKIGSIQVQAPKPKKVDIIDIEDLMPLEEKHLDIMAAIINSKSCKKECIDWWKYYFNSSLKRGKYEDYFNDTTSKIIIHTSNNLELFSVMLCYYISEDINEIKKYNLLINSIFDNLHRNFLFICKFIMTHIANTSNGVTVKNVWFEQMNVYLKKQLDIKDCKEKDIVIKVKLNSTLIVEAIRKILINYKKNKEYEQLKYYFNNLTQVTNNNLNDYFVNTICKKGNRNVNRSNNNNNPTTINQQPNKVIEIFQDKEKKTIPKPQAPYLPEKRLKPYTLVLDLDETLINTKAENRSKGIVSFRPGLHDFLLGVKEYYELVLFTAATQDYAESILQMIEAKEKIFDYKLFNYHTVRCGKTCIKDLCLLGRDLSTVIIVDNIALCFKLQKGNGILIKSYYGDNETNVNDTVLNSLLPILIKIAKDKGDVRQSISKYKSEIMNHVSPPSIDDIANINKKKD